MMRPVRISASYATASTRRLGRGRRRIRFNTGYDKIKTMTTSSKKP